jgi:hypothetical protein
LSKPVNNLLDGEYSVLIRDKIEKSKDFVFEKSLNILPEYFFGSELIAAYSKISYLSEVYRLFDLWNLKSRKILESDFYDISNDRLTAVKSKIEETIIPRIGECDRIEGCGIMDDKQDFNMTIFRQDNSGRIGVYYDLLDYNFRCMGASVKNAITNSMGKEKSSKYLLRKLGVYV